ncbi:hypothetical protein ACH5RR_031828 [Cinchona calisaya]|uniref:At1g61320/AtMIF1 LRR domain-containing protein n=1 Tax=Cinchona calisaya TaxID=153742 RepID=A0ABD2YHQ2_9GENT
MNYIDTTLLRCHKQKNGINTLNLELNNFRFFPPCDFERWLQIAIRNGLKRLRICMNHEFVLPQAVFDGTSLVNLWIGTCQLRPQLIQIIRCRGLRELTLFRVRLDDVMLQRIMSSCPLIEYLDISYCLGLVNIKATKLEKLERLNVFAPAVEHFCYAREVIHEGIQLRHPRLEMHTSRNLKNLWLFGISITDEFFLNFGKKFPSLQELRIQKCKDLCRIKILSYTINQLLFEMLLFGRRHKHCSLEQTKWQEDLKDVKLKIFRKGDRAAHQEEPQLLGWEKFLKESTTDQGYKWLFVLDLEWKHSTWLDSKIFKISDVGTS